MKKLILAGIVVIICCLVFLIVRQNTSRADIGMDIYSKTYPVSFGEWVWVYLNATCSERNSDQYSLSVSIKPIESKVRFIIYGFYNANSEIGREWYQECFPDTKGKIRTWCKRWTAQGYPISLNDFEFDIKAIQ